jgi:hypothetical protein
VLAISDLSASLASAVSSEVGTSSFLARIFMMSSFSLTASLTRKRNIRNNRSNYNWTPVSNLYRKGPLWGTFSQKNPWIC